VKCDRCKQKGFPCSEGRRLERKSKYTQQPVPPPVESGRSEEQEDVKKLMDDWYVYLSLPSQLLCNIANVLGREI
jgi:hypothetical protein